MNKQILIMRILLLGAIAAPVIVYLCVFGTNLSSDHARWAEFGSAIGGIYSPLLASLTLIILWHQVKLQAQMNVHEHEQAYLQQARENIEFYSIQIAQVMNQMVYPDKTLRMVLHENFSPQSLSDLDSQQLRQLAENIHTIIPPVFDIWDAIYPILIGLKAGKKQMFEMTHGSSIQKLVALLSFKSCVALDNFHRARTKERVNFDYQFSPLLIKKLVAV
jgi:hypothetical protein